jgi:hypothetical protein
MYGHVSRIDTNDILNHYFNFVYWGRNLDLELALSHPVTFQIIQA